jgi:hypothetical protein
MSEAASSADVHGEAIRLLRTAATAPSYETAIEQVREAASTIPPELAWRICICLSVESVWRMKPRRSRVELVQHLDRWLLELTWQES